MKQYKTVNNLVGWITFLIAATVYCMTIEPTASFWDCPEFITTGYKLEVGHPPGAPFFMLVDVYKRQPDCLHRRVPTTGTTTRLQKYGGKNALCLAEAATSFLLLLRKQAAYDDGHLQQFF